MDDPKRRQSILESLRHHKKHVSVRRAGLVPITAQPGEKRFEHHACSGVPCEDDKVRGRRKPTEL
jgi:hypothetical protein